MFNLAEIKTKLIIGAVVLAVFAVMGLTLKHYYDKSHASELVIDNLKEVNKNNEDELITLRRSKEIDATTIGELRLTVTSLTAVNDQHREEVSTQIKKILDKYGKLPITDDNLTKRDTEISEARLIGLWKTFCVKHSQYQECKRFKQGE